MRATGNQPFVMSAQPSETALFLSNSNHEQDKTKQVVLQQTVNRAPNVLFPW